MKKISVVVPVYNVAEFLPQCLNSLLQQTFAPSDYELIVVNDGSTDDSLKICQTFAHQYPHLIRLYSQKNGGLSAARNFGLQYCQGKYVLFIDSDDYVEPKMLERMYALSVGGQKKIIECNFIWEFSNHARQDLRTDYNSLNDYLVHGRVVAWNKLYLRSWLLATKVLFPTGRLYEDQAFFFKLVAQLKNIKEVAVDQIPEVHYRQRNDSISYNEASRLDDIFWIYQDILDYYQQQAENRFTREIEYRFCRNLLGNVLLRKVRQLPNQAEKKNFESQIWQKINSWFPQWKKNPYLHQSGLINLYLRLTNPIVTKLILKL
ncbi:glycosyltransferase family 2 protein [Liquorilactobacillus sicerae]|uniref:glycosyltransferase family 2 protein n=1 Tax=Liquorilactobacillus sicerae TaxID=1416943 RepID=UPI002480F06D|nr:glycosyltransferase [Liquorilactobacillus sicerae]